jgi:hypothetical protein
MRDSNESDTYSEKSESGDSSTNNVATLIESAPELAAIIEAWPTLSEDDRTAILRIIAADR